MKTTRILLAATVLATGATTALAFEPGKDWMSLDIAYKHLAIAGFRNAAEMEADGGFWEAKATKDGAWFTVRVDPRSGAVSAMPKSR